MPQQYAPTLNEDRGIGGLQNFGGDKFSPRITNLSGDYYLRGNIQKVGKILHFAVLIEANGGSFTLASSVLSPPIKPYRRTVGGVADTTVFKGMVYQMGAANTWIPQNSDGTFTLINETRTGTNTWITGHIWVE
jgi:hypothetical protein